MPRQILGGTMRIPIRDARGPPFPRFLAKGSERSSAILNLSPFKNPPSNQGFILSSLNPSTSQSMQLQMEEEGASSKKRKPSTSHSLFPPWVEIEAPSNPSTRQQPPVSAPWLDLPDPITELILQRLPLPDYLRFASVCSKWLSVQTHHRRRHHPSQPPMPPTLPWFTPGCHAEDSHLHCYCPFDRTFYHLPGLDDIHRSHGHCVFSCHGWLLYVDLIDWRQTLSLINPVTTIALELPFIYDPDQPSDFYDDGTGSMSASPADPDCTILLIDKDDVFLYRVNVGLYNGWTRLHLPLPEVLPSSEVTTSTAVFSGGRFYCISRLHCFYIVDPVLPKPLVRVIDMDTVQIPRERWSNFLVEYDGEVLLAVALLEGDEGDEGDDFLGFQVFRPGYYEKMWVRVDSVGDRALFIEYRCGFSLSAADVGCKKNCIYFPQALRWSGISSGFLDQGDFFDVFDLETGMWIGEQPHQDAGNKFDFSMYVRYDGIWLLPRLDAVSQEH